MKALFGFLAIGMFLFAGCAKDDVFDEGLDGFNLKDAHQRANVPIPFKADLCAVPDMTIPQAEFVLPNGTVLKYCSKMDISGTGSHLGRVRDSGTSYYIVNKDKNAFKLIDGKPFLRQEGDGKLVAANGDSFELTWWADISLLDRSWVGQFEIIPGSGTGKFTGSSGEFDAIGQANEVEKINCWTCEGYLVYE